MNVFVRDNELSLRRLGEFRIALNAAELAIAIPQPPLLFVVPLAVTLLWPLLKGLSLGSRLDGESNFNRSRTQLTIRLTACAVLSTEHFLSDNIAQSLSFTPWGN